jgi:hypothetical protein
MFNVDCKLVRDWVSSGVHVIQPEPTLLPLVQRHLPLQKLPRLKEAWRLIALFILLFYKIVYDLGTFPVPFSALSPTALR